MNIVRALSVVSTSIVVFFCSIALGTLIFSLQQSLRGWSVDWSVYIRATLLPGLAISLLAVWRERFKVLWQRLALLGTGLIFLLLWALPLMGSRAGSFMRQEWVALSCAFLSWGCLALFVTSWISTAWVESTVSNYLKNYAKKKRDRPYSS